MLSVDINDAMEHNWIDLRLSDSTTVPLGFFVFQNLGNPVVVIIWSRDDNGRSRKCENLISANLPNSAVGFVFLLSSTRSPNAPSRLATMHYFSQSFNYRYVFFLYMFSAF